MVKIITHFNSNVKRIDSFTEEGLKAIEHAEGNRARKERIENTQHCAPASTITHLETSAQTPLNKN